MVRTRLAISGALVLDVIFAPLLPNHCSRILLLLHEVNKIIWEKWR